MKIYGNASTYEMGRITRGNSPMGESFEEWFYGIFLLILFSYFRILFFLWSYFVESVKIYGHSGMGYDGRRWLLGISCIYLWCSLWVNEQILNLWDCSKALITSICWKWAWLLYLCFDCCKIVLCRCVSTHN